MEANIVFALY